MKAKIEIYDDDNRMVNAMTIYPHQKKKEIKNDGEDDYEIDVYEFQFKHSEYSW